MKGNNDARMTVIISTAARESHPAAMEVVPPMDGRLVSNGGAGGKGFSG